MTTITRFTKEQLISRADHLLCVGKAFIAEHPEYDGMAKDVELFVIALASLTAEPVAWTEKCEITNMQATGLYLRGFPNNSQGRDIALYAAPPAPVVPTFDEWLEIRGNKPLGWVKDAMRESYDACRAAMLNAAPSQAQPDAFGYVLCNHGRPDPDFVFADSDSAEGTAEHLNDSDAHDVWTVEPICRAAMLQGAEPVSEYDELPLDYLQGHKDGLEWAAQMAEANHPQTGDWLYDDPIELARAIRKGPDMPTVEAGNSQVIPEEVLSAIRKVARIRLDFDDFDGDRRGIADCLDEAEQDLIVTINKHASLIAAAPQQEAE